VIKRFDRLDDGRKRHVEDFCQLSEERPKDKYNGSAESCVRVLSKYASEPLIEVRKLFKLFLFSWWIANGDQHLKNLSVLITPEGVCRLTPAYDLVSTRLAIPSERDMSLTIDDKKTKLTRKSWMTFASYCKIPKKAAESLITDQIKAREPAIELIRSSFLPDELKSQFAEIINVNTAILST
jgi:serine/threonine-protein kinase HipA